jgi:homogentisate 1,2-dioxygenase
LPNELETHDEKGDFLIKIKRRNDAWSGLCHTSLDVVGWDGYNFHTVLAFTILSPLQVVHQPPPVHQTFETATFVVCSFCPRLYDYHPKSIPAPYKQYW